MKLYYQPYELKFKYPFKIARGVRYATPLMFTQLEHDDKKGYGEASMPAFFGETHETAAAFYEKVNKMLTGFSDPTKIDEILKAVDEIEPGNNAAKASVDIALHDLVGKLLNKPCYSFFNADKSKAPYTVYTIGMDDEAVLQKKVKEAEEYKMLKIKLGSEDDKKIVNTIRAITNKALVVDINQGWTDKHFAVDMTHWLKEQNVVMMEQPMHKDNVDDIAWITERSAIPVLADESCSRLADVDACQGVFHGINIKLMKCTGMNEAFKMINRARELNLKVMIGCMSETYCAISAASALTPLVDWADMDGPLLVTNNCFEGIKFIDGKITLNDAPGIGVRDLR